MSLAVLHRKLVSYHAALDCFSTNLEQEEIDTQDPGKEDNEDRVAMTDGVKIRLGTYMVQNSDQVLYTRGNVGKNVERLRIAVKGCPKDGGTIRRVLQENVIR